MSAASRVTGYDRIAGHFDMRYRDYAYDGVRETLFNFLGPEPSQVLEVGCGTGHWLAVAHEARRNPSHEARLKPSLYGIDSSERMLAQAAAGAKALAERPSLVRAQAEDLPWRDATFDRLFCVNSLHHFADRARFFAEARRVLRPGGGLLTVGMDPHTDRDDWWVYQYFEETRAIDRERFARVRTLRGEISLAGFAWTESMEAEHIEIVRPAAEAMVSGVVDPGFTSQLTVLSEEQFRRGSERLREANDAAGGELQLVTDVRLYATMGWMAP
jgi:ubiquinone/menaquinone biosynthesis C-methylase UbiE